jgi:DNA-binding NarL/FixJ family response regulator
MVGHRILVVEDEPGVRDMIVEILEAEGYEVQTVSSGGQAVTLLGQHAYDLILTDLRSTVIFVTGHMPAHDDQGFLAKPAGRMLARSFVPSERCDLVRRALTTAERPSRP